jgi:hypothetical protein
VLLTRFDILPLTLQDASYLDNVNPNLWREMRGFLLSSAQILIFFFNKEGSEGKSTFRNGEGDCGHHILYLRLFAVENSKH